MGERLLRVLRDCGYKFHLHAKGEKNEIYRKGKHLVPLPRVDVLSEVYVRSTLSQMGASQAQVDFVINDVPIPGGE